uniref:Methyltransferase domain-containing protein n=1 Tax=Ditylenchus dipsaci TaxID=166011 RepID=A0A915DLQ3_9BILA
MGRKLRYVITPSGLPYGFVLRLKSRQLPLRRWPGNAEMSANQASLVRRVISSSISLQPQSYASQAASSYSSLAMENTTYLSFYALLVPEVFCSNKVRLGVVTDGGKWVCNPNYVPEKACKIYSLGLSNQVSFDLEIQKLTNYRCSLRSIDKGDISNETKSAISSANGIIIETMISSAAKEDNKTKRPLSSIMSSLGDKSIEILKIDIEGTELEIMDEILQIDICQILIEVHPPDVRSLINFLQKLSKSGYLLFESEPNPMYISLREYCFIHESCLKKYNVKLLGKYLS